MLINRAIMRLYSYSKAISSAIQFIGTQKNKDHYKEAYGSLFSDYPMGYNFEIGVKAGAEQSTQVKQACEHLHERYDHSLLNELPEFKGKVPTFEVFALELFKQATTSIEDSNLSLKLKMDDRNWLEVHSENKVQITKTYKINCVHRHHNPDLTMEENKELYGKCSAVHGHEYTVEVSLAGAINSNGQVMSTDVLDALIEKHLITPFHKTYLNDEMGNTSGELISELFYKVLAPVLPKDLKFDLTLRETRKNSFVKF